MKFPNAYKGVKKLFIAEIISICSAVIGVVAVILSAVFKDAGATSPGLAAAGVFALVTTIAFIVAFIMQLVGLIQGSKDEDGFRMAFWIVVFMILLGVASVALGLAKVDSLIISIVEVINDAAGLVLSVFILNAISRLADQLENTEMAEKGRRLGQYLIFIYVVFLALSIISLVFTNVSKTEFGAFITAISIAAAVVEVVIYVCIVIYEYKAVKMLKE